MYIFYCIGNIINGVLGYYTHSLYVFYGYSFILLVVSLLLTIFYIVETPVYYYYKNDFEGMMESYHRITGINNLDFNDGKLLDAIFKEKSKSVKFEKIRRENLNSKIRQKRNEDDDLKILKNDSGLGLLSNFT